MSISASMVRELREKTNAGMLDCKKALEESKGDFEAAVEWLRKKGLASAAKKSDRLASEGLISSFVSDKTAVLVEVNSETDFVAKNEEFKALVKDLATHISAMSSAPASNDVVTASTFKTGASVAETIKTAIAKIGENLVFRRFVRFDSTGLLHSYIHGDGKIGVIIELSTAKNDDTTKTFANDVCLHIAAMNPIALSIEQVPAEIVSKEKEILKAKNLEQGKKADMVDKIVEGQIRKFLAESVLLEQAFVKNPDQKIKDYLTEAGKKAGESFTIKRFVRFELGEGLEKRANNFAEEVAAQSKAH
jgi:elongation factor Ts